MLQVRCGHFTTVPSVVNGHGVLHLTLEGVDVEHLKFHLRQAGINTQGLHDHEIELEEQIKHLNEELAAWKDAVTSFSKYEPSAIKWIKSDVKKLMGDKNGE